MPVDRKILTPDQADAWVAEQRSAGLVIGFTCGSFDLLHSGHVQYLESARALCDRLIVAVNSDDSIRRYKDPLRPINPLAERMCVVASLASVDMVTVLDEERPLTLLLRWKPDYYIKGGDYTTGSLRSGSAVRAYGGEVVVIPRRWSTSTTGILERISAISVHARPEPAPEAGSKPLVLLDRDGTLIENVPFLHDPRKVRVLPGVAEGLARLRQAGFRLAIVTNQQGIGLGYYDYQDFIATNQEMLKQLSAHGAAISRIYFCPHSAAEECNCRKPAPGLLLRAAREFRVPLDQTYFVGDSAADAAAGAAAGCTTILVGGNVDFREAVDRILKLEQSRSAAISKDDLKKQSKSDSGLP